MNDSESKYGAFRERIVQAKQDLAAPYGAWHAGDHDGALRLLKENIGTTYFDLLCTLVAMSELAATVSGVPSSGELPPGYELTVQIAVRTPDGTPRDIDSGPREHTWAARFMAAVWSNDYPTVEALRHVFMYDMDPNDRGFATRALFMHSATILSDAYRQAQAEGRAE